MKKKNEKSTTDKKDKFSWTAALITLIILVICLFTGSFGQYISVFLLGWFFIYLIYSIVKKLVVG